MLIARVELKYKSKFKQQQASNSLPGVWGEASDSLCFWQLEFPWGECCYLFQILKQKEDTYSYSSFPQLERQNKVDLSFAFAQNLANRFLKPSS